MKFIINIAVALFVSLCALSTAAAKDIEIARVEGVPQFKTVTKMKWCYVGPAKFKCPVTRTYTRKAQVRLILEVNHPNLSSIERKIKTCAERAGAVGIAAGLLATPKAGMLAAHHSFELCVADMGLKGVSFRTKVRESSGKWR